MTDYFSHPLVIPDTIQIRDYQMAISKTCLEQNTLVILQTGLGKTICALLVMVERLKGDQKVILVAPTKPLCEQHFTYFSKVLPYTAVRLLTGELQAKDRLKEWNDCQLAVATPQTIENDLKNRIYDLKNISLLVIDEAHRAVGGYAYTYLAQVYQEQAKNPLILAMTASPGGNEEKINEIKQALFIERTEIRTEDSPDVKPYIHKKHEDKLYLQLPDLLKKASDTFKTILKDRYNLVKKAGIKLPYSPNMKDINGIKTEANNLIKNHNPVGYWLLSLYGEILKIRHASMLAESQGLLPLQKYLEKIQSEATGPKATKAVKRLMDTPEFSKVLDEVLSAGSEEIHPKAKLLPGIVKTQLENHPEGRILIFASYREVGAYISSLLKEHGIPAISFHGQGNRGNEKGMSQKKQIETVRKFREGEYRVMVSTSVGEEGLDIPATDLVIFYEPVPSEIRTIQRRGRTGRFNAGNVLVLVTQGTMDEVNMIQSHKKEQKMKQTIAEPTVQRKMVEV